jgi:hypothetical protein
MMWVRGRLGNGDERWEGKKGRALQKQKQKQKQKRRRELESSAVKGADLTVVLDEIVVCF